MWRVYQGFDLSDRLTDRGIGRGGRAPCCPHKGREGRVGMVNSPGSSQSPPQGGSAVSVGKGVEQGQRVPRRTRRRPRPGGHAPHPPLLTNSQKPNRQLNNLPSLSLSLFLYAPLLFNNIFQNG